MDPIRFRCRSCNQALKISAERAGARVRCNRCQATIVVPTPEDPDATTDDAPPAVVTPARVEPETLPADDEPEQEERPRKRKKPRRPGGWRLVRLGLLVLLIGVIVSLVVGAGGLIPMMGGGSPRSLGSAMRWLYVFLWVTILVSAVSTLTQVGGFALCLTAPRESGARPFVVTALVCTVLSGILLTVVYWLLFQPAVGVLDLPPPPPTSGKPEDQKAWQKELEEWSKQQLKKQGFPDSPADPSNREEMQAYAKKMQEWSRDQLRSGQGDMRLLTLWQTIHTLVYGVFLVVVPLVLRAFSRAVDRKDLEPNCETLLKLGAGVIALGLFGRLFGLFLAMRLGALVTAFSMISGLVSLGWHVMFLILLLQVRQALPRR